MTNYRNYNFDLTKVTAIVRDGNYLWIAYLGSSGETTLYKSSAYDLYTVYYEITISVSEITNMKISGSSLYCSVNDNTYICMILNTANPLNDPVYISKPGGITEKSIDVAISSTDFFLLTPGELSGDNAKVLKYDSTSQTLDETIDLAKSGEIITYARSMEIDASDNLWIVTYESPAQIVKVFDSGGYDFQSWEIV